MIWIGILYVLIVGGLTFYVVGPAIREAQRLKKKYPKHHFPEEADEGVESLCNELGVKMEKDKEEEL